MSFYFKNLRPALRQILATTLPGLRFVKKRIVVSGLPRSGTSWIAKSLSLAPRVSYYFEPDSVLSKKYSNRYIASGAAEPDLENHLKKAFSGRIHTGYVIAEQGFREMLGVLRSETVLIKWVKLVLCLDWFAETFPDAIVVQTIRHPVPLALSWKAREWDPGHALKLLLSQTSLIEGPLRPYSDILRLAETFWQKTGAFWGAVSLMQVRQHRPGWIMHEHEWYCMDPVGRIRSLVDFLGLQWTEEMERFVSGRNLDASGPGYGQNRNPRTEIHKWEKNISPRELDELDKVVSQFHLPFYSGLDPEAFWKPE
ncbi:MAG: sulfotransferase [Acidobacteria bacterium]|nr:sulfotransferase [Acidobacteriota bacterium]